MEGFFGMLMAPQGLVRGDGRGAHGGGGRMDAVLLRGPQVPDVRVADAR